MKTTMRNLITIVIVLVLASFAFYWVQIRPAQIKHDCSWVKKHKDAIPERPVQDILELSDKDYNDLRKKGLIVSCWDGEKSSLAEQLEQYDECHARNNAAIKDLGYTRPAEPAKDWWVKATKDEYQFCLHDKGL